MSWIKTTERLPATGQEMRCRLEHWNSDKIVEERLVKVDEDDCAWRTADDNSEISYNWNVIEWEDTSDQTISHTGMTGMNLSPRNLTFNALQDAYVAVLQANPGKALKLAGGGAVFLRDGNIYAVTLSDAGEVEHESAGCISPLAWDDERGCWDDETPESTVADVNNPVFIDL